MTADSSIK